MSEAAPPLVAGRSCAGCTACCKLPAIVELDKPAQTWCSNCEIGEGCRIHATRPDICRNFYCAWLLDANFGDEWRPRDCRMVVKFQPRRIVVFVDKDRRASWRREPWHSQIRAWSRAALATNGEVLVIDGVDTLRIFPDREIRVTEQHPL